MSRVYFLKGGNAIKIGVSADLEKRIRTLRFTSPIKLKLLGSIEATASFERALHHKLAEHRRQGEWFADVPAVRSVVDAVLAHGVAAIGYHEPAPSNFAPSAAPQEVVQEPVLPPPDWRDFVKQVRALLDEHIVDICRAPRATSAEMLAALRRALADLEEMMVARADTEAGVARIHALAAELSALSPWNPPHSG